MVSYGDTPQNLHILLLTGRGCCGWSLFCQFQSSHMKASNAFKIQEIPLAKSCFI